MATTDQRIRDSLRDIGQAERDIDAARAAASAAQGKIDLYERRRDEIQAVLRSFEGTLNDSASGVNGVQASASSLLGDATSGFGHESALLSQIHEDRERSTDTDALSSSAYASLVNEVIHCDQCISDANASLSSARSREAAAQTARSSYVATARLLADSPDATVSVSVGSRY